MPERELRLDRVLVDLGDLQEYLDCLVGLLVEQVVQPAEIGRRQSRDTRTALDLATPAAGQPTSRRRRRREQNPCRVDHHGLEDSEGMSGPSIVAPALASL